MTRTRTSDRYVIGEWAMTQQDASAHLFIQHDQDGNQYGMRGVVVTPLGLVEVGVYDSNEGRQQLVAMEAVVDGRRHVRYEERPPSAELTSTGVAIVAHRWIRDLHDHQD